MVSVLWAALGLRKNVTVIKTTNLLSVLLVKQATQKSFQWACLLSANGGVFCGLVLLITSHVLSRGDPSSTVPLTAVAHFTSARLQTHTFFGSPNVFE